MGGAVGFQLGFFNNPVTLANAIRTGQLGIYNDTVVTVLGATNQVSRYKSLDLDVAVDLFHNATSLETKQGALKLIADILEERAKELAPIVAQASGSFLHGARRFAPEGSIGAFFKQDDGPSEVVMAVSNKVAGNFFASGTETVEGSVSINDDERRRIEETLKRSRGLVALRGGDEDRTLTYSPYPDSMKRQTHYYGVPSFARLVIVGSKDLLLPSDPLDTILLSPDTIFRHYVRRRENLDSVVQEKILLPGQMPFFSRGGRNGIPWHTLKGAFLTLPQFSPEDAGVDTGLFVDFTLFSGTGMLRLSREDERYFMIPGISKKGTWIWGLYEKWIEEGKPTKEEILKQGMIAEAVWREDEYNWKSFQRCDFWYDMLGHFNLFQEMDAQGELLRPSQIPIQIVQAGEVSRNKK